MKKLLARLRVLDHRHYIAVVITFGFLANYGLAQAISDLLRDMDRLFRENRLLRIELAREQKKSRHSKSDD